MTASVTAALLVIGDEILSGRTKDKNIGYIADYLTAIGIDLSEVRIVPDMEDEIAAAVNALRQRYTYLFTTGGIGPTHDDITADSIAKAFGVAIDHDPRAVALLRERYQEHELTAARLRMARIPHGADLIENPISKAPGFRIGNVIVMAGVPSIMQAMLDLVAPTLQTGARMVVETVDAGSLGEGAYGDGLARIAAEHAEVSIGSYPSFTSTGFNNQIVIRAKDAEAVSRVAKAVRALVESLKSDRVPL
ncbi:competence/damage-inducible protein A [Microvirga flavescens]|uniref:competence/damage-inducible protein A n=1 Tax=Microvirga flavescens TaxID=2249811 RepID=UPI000DD637FC|nr:molybdopterin-binding protein [Microvirga flavescens]